MEVENIMNELEIRGLKELVKEEVAEQLEEKIEELRDYAGQEKDENDFGDKEEETDGELGEQDNEEEEEVYGEPLSSHPQQEEEVFEERDPTDEAQDEEEKKINASIPAGRVSRKQINALNKPKVAKKEEEKDWEDDFKE